MDLASFPYNYFNTKKNISLKEIQYLRNILDFYTYPEKSILENNKDEIKNFLTVNKLNSKKIENLSSLNILNQIYNDYLINERDINKFCENFVNYKYNILKSNELIEYFTNLKIKFRTKKGINYDPSFFIENPIIYQNIVHLKKNEINKEISNEINYYKNTDNIKLTLDIFTQGNFINYSLPSVGIIYPNFSTKIGPSLNPNNYIDFFKILIHKDLNEVQINKKLPLLELNIPNVISDLLILESNNIFESNNDVKNLIKKKIQEINIDMNNIFYVNANNKNKTIKSVYIIPYKNKDEKIVLMSNSDIKSFQRKNMKDVLNHNYNIHLHAIKDLKNINNTEKLGFNSKNVLACYLFYIIQLLYDINKEYINKINTIITKISESREKIFKRLNIKNAFLYISLLSDSLYKFKLILLNSFYNFFIPSKVSYDNYGMKVIDEDNNIYSMVPESDFINSNDYIFNNYCFNVSEDTLVVNEENLKKFIINIKYDHDAFDVNEKLEFGAFAFNNENMINSMNIFLKYLIDYRNSNNFSLYIVNILSSNFIEKQIYPYEIIDSLLFSRRIQIMTPKINKSDQEKLIKELKSVFEINYSASVSYLFKLIELNKKWEKIGAKNDNIRKEKDRRKLFLLLSTRFYMFIAMSNYYICQNIIVDVELKNKLLKEYQMIKKKYEEKMMEYIKTKEINE